MASLRQSGRSGAWHHTGHVGGSVADMRGGPCPKETGGVDGMMQQIHGTRFYQTGPGWWGAAWRRRPQPAWSPPDVGHIIDGPSPGRGGRKQGTGPGLEQGMAGPATASGQGPSPIPVLRPQKPLHMPGGDGHRGKSLKLLEKIPEDAEATVVLVGEEAGGPLPGCGCFHRVCGSWALACSFSFQPQPGPRRHVPPAFPDSPACPSSLFHGPLLASRTVFHSLGLLASPCSTFVRIKKKCSFLETVTFSPPGES